MVRYLAILLGLCVGQNSVRGQDSALQNRINQTIKRGVAALRAMPRNERGLIVGETGLNALVAWTLLEADVPGDDKLIARTAQALRKDAVEQFNTYAISVLIMFFDRLGDPGDEPLIESLALRLLAAQGPTGGWRYECPAPDADEKKRLLDLIDKAQEQRDKGEIGPSREKPSARKPRSPDARIKKLVDEMESRPKFHPSAGDNSNTQFAMLALWVARRHGVPVDEALARVAQRFRDTQQRDGGWTYSVYPKQFVVPATSTMTCAGLLGIALGHGIHRKKGDKPVDLKKDPLVKEGLRLMDEVMKQSTGQKDFKRLSRPEYFHYFLFSMERMAVIYNLKSIGDKDWYVWGAKLLVDSQGASGSWGGEHAPADSCFALLFLKRANVAEDLTFDLLGINPIMKKKGPSKKPQPDPFDLPQLLPKDKKKTKGASRDDANPHRDAGIADGPRPVFVWRSQLGAMPTASRGHGGPTRRQCHNA